MSGEALLHEYLGLVLVHLLAVASPGPDFALIVRQSLGFGRMTGLATAAGIGTGIIFHVAYSVFGLSLLIVTTPVAFQVLKVVAAVWLVYLGAQGLRAKPHSAGEIGNPAAADAPARLQAFSKGLLTNLLNVKAVIWFISVFTVFISARTPFGIKLGYGATLVVVTFLWFAFLATVLSGRRVRVFLRRASHWIERGMGMLLIAFGLRILFLDHMFDATLPP